MENIYIIKTEGLSKKFKGRQIISDINIRLKKGDIYGLLGLNGAGKTTTLKLMLGFLKPTGGSIYINNDIYNRNDYNIDTYNRRLCKGNLEILFACYITRKADSGENNFIRNH